METPLYEEIEKRFGVVPNFFRFTSADGQITANLWGFARFGYLDNPLPSLFKERLFVYLSRFCEVRYCIARHLGFLVGLGYPAGDAQCLPQTVEAVLPLLLRALPRERELDPLVEFCSTREHSASCLPEPDSLEEKTIFACAAHVFLQTADAPRSHEALRRILGESRLDHLNLLLTFVRTAHYWTKLHPELAFEADVQHLLAAHQVLAACILNDPEAGTDNLKRQVAEELAALRESEAQALIANLPGGAVFIVDHYLRYQLAEGEAFRAAGFTSDTFVGRTLDEALGPALAAAHTPYFRQALAGEPFELEHAAHGRVFLTRGAPLRNKAGHVFAALAVSIDVTEHRRTKAALRGRERDFNAIANLVPDLLWRSDPTGHTSWYNQRWYDYTGQTAEQAENFGWTEVIHPEDRDRSQSRYLHAIRSGQSLRQEHRIRGANGSYRWFLVQARPFYNETGRLAWWFGAATDIHEERMATEALRQSLREKEELLKEVHHRVKNNLQVITSLLNLQAAQIEDERVLALFDETRNRVQSIASIHELIYRSASLSAIDLGMYARQLVPDLLRFYGIENRIRTEVRGAGVSLELQRAVPFGLLLNELISNVCKHAFPGGRKGGLNVTIAEEDGQIILGVADTGVGLPKKSDGPPASSLGLQLVYNLARQLKGTVKLCSDRGTTAEVRLPKQIGQDKGGVADGWPGGPSQNPDRRR